MARLRLHLRGAVQGVGFRPFVYRLATSLDLKGWVLNSTAGLVVEVEGERAALEHFHDTLLRERPAAALITSLSQHWLAPLGEDTFRIRLSEQQGAISAVVLPDLATCHRCLDELWNPADRRYLYPFINCTHCGPRFSIITAVPYDRPHTTMRDFALCPDCAREYKDPADRRFHAQPTACPRCGPHLWTEPAAASNPLAHAFRLLEAGGIVALKGIGGFQLLCDARSSEAVRLLRQRKMREEKPFAVMMPSLDVARRYAEISATEAELLASPAAPIVLLRPRHDAAEALAPEVARSSPFLGFMLPYSPLHHLLLRAFPYPLVATSGNRSDEPIAIDNEEAQQRLRHIADLFVLHNRPIARPVDDSVARVVAGAPQLVRRARGYAPLPIVVNESLPPILAVGGHLKNTIAIAWDDQLVVSQHVGDLDTAEARQAFERAIDDLLRLYRFTPHYVACDLHPDYASTIWAQHSGLPVIAVQHHQAHVVGCAAENLLEEPFLGVAWDGTGWGEDGLIWGGEFFRCDASAVTRVAHLRPFPLPGGEAAIREGWRAAAGLRFAWKGPASFAEHPVPAVLARMLERGIQAPLTTSVGRLFDALAAMLGVAGRSRFEGQAAMQLERVATLAATDAAYHISPSGDWSELLDELHRDLAAALPAPQIARRFHNALAQWVLAVARQHGLTSVVVSGGVFQNALLCETLAALLAREGFRLYQHKSVPPNDGGLSLGQAVLAARHLRLVAGRAPHAR